MALYSYRKVNPEPDKLHDPDLVVLNPPPSDKDRLTLGKILSGFKHDFINLLVESKFSGFLIPLILILIGLNIIFKQIWPDIEQQLRVNFGLFRGDTVALVEGDYIERNKYIADPGSEYFKSITEQAADKHVLQPDPTSNNYHGRFTISIPALDLNNLPVQANVDSSNEDSYHKALQSALAHFKGTGLPFSPVNNNIVIYGHSSSGDYYERTHDFVGAFSRLNRIKIGDLVNLNIEGKVYTFRITKSKIVEPNETEIITGTTNKRTLTLFTCFPSGNSAQRFVAIGNPVNTD